MRYTSTVVLLAACISQILAHPAPEPVTAARLASINASLDTKYAQLLNERDACIAATPFQGEKEECVRDWHMDAADVENDRYFWNPEGSAQYELARDRIDFHWIGMFPNSDGFFINN